MKIKIQKKKILLSIIFAVILVLFCSNIFAQITQNVEYEPIGMNDPDNKDKTISVLEYGIKVANNSFIGEKIVQFVCYVARFIITTIMQIMGYLFAKVGIVENSSMYFPMPDNIVFNLIPFFDPNFINPSDKAVDGAISYIGILTEVIAPVYYSSVAFVGSVFIIFALIIGLKLAVSVSPQQKAQYKSAIMTWITGLLLLYGGHFIMSGIFFINEQIVDGFHKASTLNAGAVKFEYIVETKVLEDAKEEEDSQEVPDNLVDMDKVDQMNKNSDTSDTKKLSDAEKEKIEKSINIDDKEEVVEQNKKIEIKSRNDTSSAKEEEFENDLGAKIKRTKIYSGGYNGLFNYYYSLSCNGDIIATVIMGIFVGQTIMLMILYTKRMFTCILLGLFYPFVICIDTCKKVLGKQGGGFQKWLSEFGTSVFIQTIHAIIMYFVYSFVVGMMVEASGKSIGEVKGTSNCLVITAQEDDDKLDSEAQAIINLMGLTQIITLASFSKIEKMAKDLLGFGEAPMGGAKESAMSAMAGYAMVKNAAGNIKDNYTGMRDGAKKVRDLKKEYNEAKANENNKGKKNVNTNIPDENLPGQNGAPLPGGQGGTGGGGLGTGYNNTANQAAMAGLSVAAASPVMNSLQDLAGVLDGLAQVMGMASPSLNRVGSSLDKLANTVKNGNGAAESINNPLKKMSSQAAAVSQNLQEGGEGGNKSRSSADIKKELGLAQRELLAKTAAAAASPSIVLAGASIGAGAGDEKIGAAIISAGDFLVESAGKLAAQTGAAKVVGSIESNIYENIEYHNSTTIMERKHDRDERRAARRGEVENDRSNVNDIE